ncbi:hypothetical protein [Streptomyces sp. S.PB5]|uniref:hypothetical protein n=1 Tax=Streptomyces sp. S.PB5 TaxID=3020844 RepID=UPI0025B1D3E9|nr:hypothetical protein [Streptomyces sp. S.PB5]MDN3027343.1 hypothetical protein [Streptomyces sp. S.PB5]
MSLRRYGFVLGLSALCRLLGLLVAARPTAPVLTVAVLLPAALAATQLYASRFGAGRLSGALDLTLAPSWPAGLAAVCAALAALTAPVVRPASHTAADRCGTPPGGVTGGGRGLIGSGDVGCGSAAPWRGAGPCHLCGSAAWARPATTAPQPTGDPSPYFRRSAQWPDRPPDPGRGLKRSRARVRCWSGEAG